MTWAFLTGLASLPSLPSSALLIYEVAPASSTTETVLKNPLELANPDLNKIGAFRD